ncbi:MAG: peptidylprolyl isomerase [Lachnospirales bacterium]
MKKFISSFLIAALSVSLVSCSDNSTTDETATEDTEVAEETTDATETTDTTEEVTEIPEGTPHPLDAFNFVETTEGFTQLDPLQEGEMYAVIDTTMGEIKVKFLPDVAPLAVENFVVHSENGYYDGLSFHRVIDDFVIQGGDPLGNGMGGESIWGEPFVNEVSPNARHFYGALAMANSGVDTNGSQFYIVETNTIDDAMVTQFESMKADLDQVIYEDEYGQQLKASDFYTEEIIDAYLENGGYFSLDFGYTVFGQVVEGLDVLSEIAAVETDENDKPVEDVLINTISVFNSDEFLSEVSEETAE